MSQKDEFVALLDKQSIKKGDVIFLLEGDGYYRVPYAAELFKGGFARLIAIVGNDERPTYGSFISHKVKDKLVEAGVPERAIFCEETSANTKEEAERAMELARERNWRTMLIVTSPHHQYRAFLTFLHAMKKSGLSLKLINAVAPLSMTEELPWGTRTDLLEQDFAKIEPYQKKGDVASYEEGIEYLRSI
jgi:uncharacterized SAM-binding protein YcdF (DUF218 family)